MAAEIDVTTGEAAVFTAGQAPWHRLGRQVAEAQSSQEAIALAGLDWSVDKRNVAAAVPGGGWVPIADQFATVRNDTDGVLGIVGKWYEPLQNREAFDFMDAIVGEGLCRYETAGALKGGRTIWMMARIPSEIRAAGSDVIEPYLLLTNSHDGSSAVRIIPTTVRVVCQNTLTLALRQARGKGLTIRHTESLQHRVQVARNQLGLVVERLEELDEQIGVLTRTSLSTEELGRYFAGLVEGRSEKSQKKLIEAFYGNFENERQRLPGVAGSLWAAYNAVSEYTDHQMTVFGKDNVQVALENRLQSVWFGSGRALKEQAFESALGMAS